MPTAIIAHPAIEAPTLERSGELIDSGVPELWPSYFHDSANGLIAVGGNDLVFTSTEPGNPRGFPEHVSVYNIDTGKRMYTITKDDGPALSTQKNCFGHTLAMTSDQLVVGSFRSPLLVMETTISVAGSVHAYDAQTGAPQYTIEAPNPEEEIAFGITIAANDQYLLIADRKAVYQYDTLTATPVRTLLRYARELPPYLTEPQVAIDISGHYAALKHQTSQEISKGPVAPNTIAIFDLRDGSLVSTLPLSDIEDELLVNRNAIAIDGSVVAASTIHIQNESPTYTVEVYDWVNKELKYRLQTPEDAIAGFFGCSIAMHDDRLLIGNPQNYFGRFMNRGSVPENQNLSEAFLYEKDSGNLLLRIRDPADQLGYFPTDLHFGVQVSLHGRVPIIGSTHGIGLIRSNIVAWGVVLAFDEETGLPIRRYSIDDSERIANTGWKLAKMNEQLVIASPFKGARRGEVFAADPATGAVAQRFQTSALSDYVFGWQIASNPDTLLVTSIGLSGSFADNLFDGKVEIIDLPLANTRRVLYHPKGLLAVQFGGALALPGSYTALTATQEQPTPQTRGVIYLYDTQSGQLTGELAANDFEDTRQLGSLLGTDGHHLYATLTPAGFQAERRIIVIDPATASRIATLEPTTPSYPTSFGTALDVSEHHIAVGANRDRDIAQNAGAVYLFQTSDHSQIAKLLPTTDSPRINWGSALALSDRHLAVLASTPGLAGEREYLIDVIDLLSLERVATFVTGDPINGENPEILGAPAIEIIGSQVFLGQPDRNGRSYQSGKVLIFDIPQHCPGDTNNDNTVDLADLNAVLALFGQPTTSGADLDNSGAVDLADLNTVLSAFGTTCTP